MMAKDPIAFGNILNDLRRSDRQGMRRELHDMDLNDDDAVALADIIANSNVLSELIIRDSPRITEIGITALAKAMEKNTAITELHLVRIGMSETAVGAIADMVKKNQTVKKLFLSSNDINDAGACLLAEGLKSNFSIQQLNLFTNSFGDRGIEAFGEMLGGNDSLVMLHVNDDHISPEAFHAVETCVNANDNKNLHYIGTNTARNPLFERCTANQTKTRECLKSITKNFEEITPADWWDIACRIPAIQYQGEKEVESHVSRFEEFLDSLPTFKSDQPLTLESLTASGKNGRTLLDNPRNWQDFGSVVTALNHNGIHIRADTILKDEAFQPIWEKILERGMARHVFTEENWKGASPEELKAVLKILPPEVKEQIPNRHTLLAELGRQSAPDQSR